MNNNLTARVQSVRHQHTYMISCHTVWDSVHVMCSFPGQMLPRWCTTESVTHRPYNIRPTVTFPLAEHSYHHPLEGTQFQYC